MSAGLTGEKAAKGKVLINVLSGRGHGPLAQSVLNDEMRVVGDQSLMLSFREGHVPFGLLDDAHGVEPICTDLPIALSTYYDHLAKRADPSRLSDRFRRDEALRPEVLRVFEENWRVYGTRKV